MKNFFISFKKLQIFSSAAIFALILILNSSTVFSETLTSSTKTEITREEAIERIVELVNIERKKEGLKPLKLSRELLRPAAIRAKEITKLFSHTRPNGLPFNTAFYGIDYEMAGENIAAGQTSCEMVMQQWMDSPGHRANILNKNYDRIGIGYLYDKKTAYKHFWVQHFTKSKKTSRR